MSEEPENPFKGTPFEALFQQLGGAMPGGAGTPDLGAIFAQVQQLLSGSGDGRPVNWELAKDLARKTVSAAGDRSMTSTDQQQVAEDVAGAMSPALPAEAQQLAGPMAGMLRQLGGSIFGAQVGQGLGELAGEVVSSSDIGLPLGPAGRAVLLPDNVKAFAEGLGISDEDVRLYLALRECAHQRLFAGV